MYLNFAFRESLGFAGVSNLPAGVSNLPTGISTPKQVREISPSLSCFS